MHFLPKPFGLKQLAAKVKEVLSARAGQFPQIRIACASHREGYIHAP